MKKIIKKTLKNIVSLFPSSTVLMLHKVTVDNPKETYHLSTQNFYKLIASFDNWGTMDEVVLDNKRGKIVITFDDIPKDVYEVAYPYLKEKGIPFTVFITAGLLDKEGYITKEQLKELANDPLVTIGGHCFEHIPLPKQNEKEQEHQVKDSFNMLTELTGRKIRYLAYPYGQRNDTSLRILKNSKTYSYAFLTGRDFYNILTRRNRFELPRMEIGNKAIDSAIQKLKKYL